MAVARPRPRLPVGGVDRVRLAAVRLAAVKLRVELLIGEQLRDIMHLMRGARVVAALGSSNYFIYYIFDAKQNLILMHYYLVDAA